MLSSGLHLWKLQFRVSRASAFFNGIFWSIRIFGVVLFMVSSVAGSLQNATTFRIGYVYSVLALIDNPRTSSFIHPYLHSHMLTFPIIFIVLSKKIFLVYIHTTTNPFSLSPFSWHASLSSTVSHPSSCCALISPGPYSGSSPSQVEF